MINSTAPLSSSLFMMERELPSYLSTAYSLTYNDKTENQGKNTLEKICTTIKNYFSLIRNLIHYRPRESDFTEVAECLDDNFQKINEKISKNNKPICAYFVSSYDENGAILGKQLYYYHHYKIRNFEKDYAVAAKVVHTQAEMKEFLKELKTKYPDREIKVVDIVAHGFKSTIAIYNPSKESEKEGFITPSNMQNVEFNDCARDATIILDACSTGTGHHNIADEIARKNPVKRS